MTTVMRPNSPIWAGGKASFPAPTVDIIQPDRSSARPKPAGKRELAEYDVISWQVGNSYRVSSTGDGMPPPQTI